MVDDHQIGSMDHIVALIEKLSWLLPLVLLFGLLVLMLATLQHFLAEIRLQSGKRHLPITALRGPGESTRHRIDRTNGEIAAFVVAIGTIPLSLYAALLSYVHFLYLDLGWMETGYFGILSAGFILYGMSKIKRLKARRRRLYIRYEGQLAVAQEVSRLIPEGHRVYHDFPTDRFHIDHIIVGPQGVFTVTAKVFPQKPTYRGESHAMLDGRRIIFGNKRDHRTLAYAAFQASWLAKWLLTATGEALAVQPILTIPGWRIKTLRKSDVLAVEPFAIGEAVSRFQGHPLSPKSLRLVCEQIEAKCRIEALS
jgi:hypothetical protein